VPVLLDSGLDQSHQHTLLVMHWRVLLLVKFIPHLGCDGDLLGPLGGEELASPRGLFGEVVLDELVHRNVNHVVLNSQVGAGGVHSQSLLVVEYYDLGLKVLLQGSADCFGTVVNFAFGVRRDAFFDQL